jgi:hypothetical protein
MKTMSSLIKYIVREALQSGQLTARDETQIQQLFQRGCNMENIEALTQLQLAVKAGVVKRVSDNRGNFF